ncbi:hypothetical protein BC833DRAFT_607911 [Globomyces pollinis-pini]|nr:hypothetical protein BC833DRAFT_607911 [Globomyces pollinis-pini]
MFRKEPEEARPSGQHNEVPPLNNRRFGLFPGTWDNNGGGFSLNVGFFPFFPMAGIHIGGGNMGQLNSTEEVQAFMSRVLLMFATLILVTIILY